MNGVKIVRGTQEDFLQEDLDKMSSFSMPRILSSLTYLGIVLKPHEFQKIALNRFGKEKVANSFWNMKMYFNPNFFDKDPDINYAKLSRIDPVLITPGILKIAAPYIESRSCLQPYLFESVLNTIERAKNNTLTKTSHIAMSQFDSPSLSAVAGLYYQYGKSLNELDINNYNNIIKESSDLHQVFNNTKLASNSTDIFNNIATKIPSLNTDMSKLWLNIHPQYTNIDYRYSITKVANLNFATSDPRTLLGFDDETASLVTIASVNYLTRLLLK
mgnify:CR=1 FL=1